jgi:segregation and condensation protein A
VNEIFEIDVEVYKGPFELLLVLIQKHELDVCDVPIASITKDFLSHIKNLANKQMESISGFLVVAATLLKLKANALLPKEVEDDDFEEMSDDKMSGEELVVSLIEYKMYQNAAGVLETKLEREKNFFTRPVGIDFVDLNPNFLKAVSPGLLADIYTQLLKRANPVVDLSHIVGSQFTVEQKIDYVINFLKTNKGQTTFSKLVMACGHKIEKIVTLIALLELHRVGAVKLSQAVNFGEIEVKRGNLNYAENLN